MTTRQPLLLLAHSLVSKSCIFDLVVVEALTARGFDVYLTDWGVPDELEASNTLETYADYYLPRMVRAARRDVEGSACDFRPSLRRAPPSEDGFGLVCLTPGVISLDVGGEVVEPVRHDARQLPPG
jgi:hypothetical protein